MGAGPVTNYNTEKLIAGEIKTHQAPLAEGTYYPGALLGFDSTEERWEYNATPAVDTPAAVFLGNRTDDKQIIAADGDVATIIVAGEVAEGGIVDSSGAALTITEAMRATLFSLGIYLKK